MDYTGTPRYGHLSNPDPDFAPEQQQIKDTMSATWALPLSEIRTIFKDTPPSLPKETPQDLNITHEMIPVRDGAKIELRIYKSKTVPKNALLYFNSHGGGIEDIFQQEIKLEILIMLT